MKTTKTKLSIACWALTPLLAVACGSSGPSVPGDGASVERAAETYYAVLFVEGSSARYRVTKKRSWVTREAAVRGGPKGPDDWVDETQKGELVCSVKRVQTFPDLRAATVECEGQVSLSDAPVAGVWIEVPNGLYHGYEDDFRELHVWDILGGSSQELQRPIRGGKRDDLDFEYLTEISAENVCVTNRYLVGGDGTKMCFAPGQWPDHISSKFRGVGWAVTMKLERLR